MIDEIGAGEALTIIGIVAFLAFIISPVFSHGFCTKPVPLWARQWRDVAGAVVALRWASRMEYEFARDLWVITLAAAHLALAQSVVAFFNVVYALRDGNRCRRLARDRRRNVAVYIGGTLLFIILIVIILVWVF